VHVVVTTDTLSGVWTYTRELVTGLIGRGVRVTLVSFGEIPMPSQTTWMENLPELDYRPTAFRLDWMQYAEQDLRDSSAYLTDLVHELQPDLLHLNQMCYGNLPVRVPRIVVAHRDFLTWWRALHANEPEDREWLKWYRSVIRRGMAQASAVIAPTAWMRDAICECYTQPGYCKVIYPGRNPLLFNPYVSKEHSVLAVGRFADVGKQVSLLTQHSHRLPVCIVGTEAPARPFPVPIRADVKVATETLSVALKGPQTDSQMRTLYSRASLFAATSRYEPFGMAAVEAALSRCAIVANDIPSLREVWDDAAVYFRTNDAESLAEVLDRLSTHRDLCRGYANRAYQRARERFSAKRMLDEYTQLYGELVGAKMAVA
jgi:glycogen synthase